MCVDIAAKELWKQIELKEKTRIFGWRTRFGLLLTRFLPEKFVINILSRGVIDKSPKNDSNI